MLTFLGLSSSFAAPSRAAAATRCRAAQAAAAPQLRSYEYDGWKLTYRHKAASPGREADAPLLLVHPIGIGLDSWFWEKFLGAWTGGDVYAPDLIGAGGGDTWDPAERGLFVPLDWARGCEALWRQEIRRPCVVVTQGGLAPVGVLLAARSAGDWDGARAVTKVVHCSPPTWEEMVTGVPEGELRRNYDALRSPLGRAAVGLLERRGPIKFFSDLFLFEEESDDAWLDNAAAACGAEVREPVLAFNAGLCNARSYEVELTEQIAQPTLVLSGRGDKREAARRGYEERMRACRLKMLPGANVLPWEAARETAEAIAEFAAA